MELFNVRGHRHACQSSNSIVVGADAICRDDVTQKIETCGSDPGFIRGKLEFVKAQAREEGS